MLYWFAVDSVHLFMFYFIRVREDKLSSLSRPINLKTKSVIRGLVQCVFENMLCFLGVFLAGAKVVSCWLSEKGGAGKRNRRRLHRSLRRCR